MADTKRSLSALLAALADNTTGAITPQDLRDVLVTVLGTYGSIYTADGSTSQTSIGTTPVKLTGFAANGTDGGVTPDHTTDRLTCTVAGTYQVLFQCSFSGTNSAEVQFHIRKNGVETAYGCHRKLGTGGDVGSCSTVGPDIVLAATDYIEIYVESDDAGGADQVTVVDAQLTARMIA